MSNSMEKRTLMFALLGLIVWSSIASITAFYYYAQYNETRQTFEQLKSLIIQTNVLIDYGNGTENWHNETVTAGSTAFDGLLAATKNVEYRVYSFGVMVESINGVKTVVESPTTGRAWLWYHWNATTSKWIEGTTGADAYVLRPDDSTTWRYQSY